MISFIKKSIPKKLNVKHILQSNEEHISH
jgi:hypothetical protein